MIVLTAGILESTVFVSIGGYGLWKKAIYIYIYVQTSFNIYYSIFPKVTYDVSSVSSRLVTHWHCTFLWVANNVTVCTEKAFTQRWYDAAVNVGVVNPKIGGGVGVIGRRAIIINKLLGSIYYYCKYIYIYISLYEGAH